MAASKSVSRKSAAKKAGKTRKSRAAVKKAAKTAANVETLLKRQRMPEDPPGVVEIDERIAIVRTNLRELVEQATARSGASDEELLSQRIAEQEAKLAVLRKQRDALAQSGS